MSKYAGIICLLIAVGFVGPVRAAVVFDNGSPDLSSAGNRSDARFNFTFIENASLSATANVDGIRYWGLNQINNFQGNGVDQGFTLNFFNLDSNGLPTVLLASRSLSYTSTPVGNFGFVTINQYDSTFAPVTLNAGTTYGVSVFHIASAAPGEWRWTNSLGGDNHNWVDSGGNTLPSGGTDSAFQLTASSVPEPATLGLLAGAPILFLRRKRARQGTSADLA
jgi:hypothetical protein